MHFITLKLQITDQEEEAGARQPEVSSSMAVDVEVLSRQVTVWIEDLQCALEQHPIYFNYPLNNSLPKVFCCVTFSEVLNII